MSKSQKLVKFFAIVLAITLIISIISFIVSCIASIFYITYTVKNSEEETIMESVNVYSEEITEKLEVNVTSATVYIKQGDKLALTTNSKYITSKQDGTTFVVYEKFAFDGGNKEVTIYVPEGFEDVEINIGAGRLEIDTLTANKLELSLGAGNTYIHSLNVKEAEISTGAGIVNLKNGTIENLELATGIGDVNITLDILDEASIDAGVGNLDVTFLKDKSNYTLDIAKGVGNIIIDGKSTTQDTLIGNGKSKVEINGGVGNIHVYFTDII